MTLDLDTCLVTLYTIVDDLDQTQVAPHLPRSPGKHPELSDSAVFTLALCAQWLRHSERGLVRDAMAHRRACWCTWGRWWPRSWAPGPALIRSWTRCWCPCCAGVGGRTIGSSARKPPAAAAAVATTGTTGASGCWPSPARGGLTGLLLAPASTEDR